MRCWVGGYADAIGVLRAGAVDSPLASGGLARAGDAAAADGPSWIARHPSLDVIYAAQEHAGTVQAFVRTGDETFAPLGDAADAGELVCHVAVAPDGGSLIASCWGDGRVVRFPLAPDGRLGTARVAASAEDPYADPEPAPLPGLEAFAGLGDLPLFGQPPVLAEALSAPVADAEPEPSDRVSRAHQARFLPEGVVATTDLGFDLVRFWSGGGGGGGALREVQQVVLPRGSGPRHTVWHPSGHLYVVTELSLEVFVLAPDPSARASERWRIVGGTPLARGTTAGVDFAAEIALTRDAESVVVGIRGSDTLASLRVRQGGAALAPVAQAEAGAAWPRHHVIERDTVLVAGQRGNEVVSLGIDERTGFVGRVRHRVETPSPTCLVPDAGR